VNEACGAIFNDNGVAGSIDGGMGEHCAPDHWASSLLRPRRRARELGVLRQARVSYEWVEGVPRKEESYYLWCNSIRVSIATYPAAG
jgi:hypothetical protein